MKKSLLALAAMGAFAGAAQAQSSVTVYGILDVGYIGGNVRGNTAGISNKTTTSTFGNSAETTSRLGFRGTEDLGGGTRAFFTVETNLIPTSGTNFSGLTNRQSFVGLGQKGLGQAMIGTQYTPIHTAIAVTSAGQQNNIPGDVIYAVDPGSENSASAYPTSSTLAGYGSAYTTRTGNMLKAESDTFAGFKVTAFYAMNNQDSTQSCANQNTAATCGGKNNRNGWGLGANYQWQKLLVTANYQSFSATNPGSTVAAFGSSAMATTGSNVKDNQFYGAAAYDFGIVKVFAQYSNRKVTDQINTANTLTRSAQQLGVRGFVTKTIEGWASVGNGRINGLTSTVTDNFTGYQLGSNYWLSKRTNLYAIFGSNVTSSASTGVGAGTNAYAVGARHTF